MKIEEAYNEWAGSYDISPNSTRDLEAQAIRATIPPGPYAEVIELGCGTGKNTEWLATQAGHLTAVDLSNEMMERARLKLPHSHINFQPADITQPWFFASRPVDLLVCSLVLEHIEHLEAVFAQARQALRVGGLFYVGELHPSKQYQGSKARFERTGGSVCELESHVHHVSDYIEAAHQHGLRCVRLHEWFDTPDRTGTPRIISFLFQRAE
ncbi:class I SAM-dependent DNA methyltransferase [Hymenobacter fodinae]|uniref:Class I SAM-dependent methyltransferase n=1 Tax=Hymenobacter fodinae TaxID=2510796 RepID=A0A4Z0P770_9BACT|nr:class I SAM-dependent methyltransferase [Hymenobacter fodinae]TGE08009.1 class I SAM-dependent methyltransferase [Hymenobacter fodinae]